MSTDKKPTMLRLKDEMYEKIKHIAYSEHRSMNAQIEYVLSLYIEQYEIANGTIVLDD